MLKIACFNVDFFFFYYTRTVKAPCLKSLVAMHVSDKGGIPFPLSSVRGVWDIPLKGASSNIREKVSRAVNKS